MISYLQSESLRLAVGIFVGSIWVFHGLYSKILNGIPRHHLIVGKILGPTRAGIATKTIGLLEVLLGCWVFLGWRPVECAVVQTVALVAMNTLEIALAAELLVLVPPPAPGYEYAIIGDRIVLLDDTGLVEDIMEDIFP